MRFKIFRPVSFRALLWFSFLCICFPFVMGLIDAGISVDSVANDCALSVERTYRTSRTSQLLLDQTASLERRARQYIILEDPRLLEAYSEQRLALEDAVRELSLDIRFPQLGDVLKSFSDVESEIAESVRNLPESEHERERALLRFSVLSKLADEILDEVNLEAEREAKRVQSLALEAINPLIWRASALVVLTGLLSALFVRILSRPIREIHYAITRMGSGDFADEISVGGPTDMQMLGARLEWLRRRLIRLEAQRTKFLALVSHEIKTPLSAIREGVSLLDERVLGYLAPAQSEVVDVLRNSTDRLEMQVEDLLTFTIASTRDSQVPVQLVDFTAIVEEAFVLQRVTALAREIDIEMEAEQCTVRGDPEQLRAIVDNLISNALKFTPADGKVQIKLYAAPHAVVLEVRDTGFGVEETERANIFEPFYRGKAAKLSQEEGSGLGLSIVAEHIKAHGGIVEVDKGDEGGALFRVRLPKGRGSK